MKKSISLLLLLAFTLSAYSQKETPLKYTFNKKNVVASAIDGTWKSEEEGFTILFEKDTSVLSLIPEKFHKNFAGEIIYHAGFMIIPTEEQELKAPFILITVHGNSQMIFFKKYYDEPYGDSESFNVFIIKGKTKETDRLFIGDDSVNREFAEYVRIR